MLSQNESKLLYNSIRRIEIFLNVKLYSFYAIAHKYSTSSKKYSIKLKTRLNETLLIEILIDLGF